MSQTEKKIKKKIKPENYSSGHGTGFLPGESFPGQ